MTGERPLQGQVALVAGASSGIGAAIAVALAANGAAVSLVARRTSELSQVRDAAAAHDVTAISLVADLAHPAEPARVMAATVESLGPVDILVNSAAAVQINRIDQIEPRHWELQMRLNVTAPYLLSRLALPGMRERGHGWIVNISSAVALETIPGTGPYAVSKQALNTLTELIDAENRERGIRAVACCLGWVATRLSPALEGYGVCEQDLLRPGDVADAVLWIMTRPHRVGIGPIIHLAPTSPNAATRGSVERFIRGGAGAGGAASPDRKEVNR
ncbi:MAG: SDR family oxidoreductase [Streptosporangiaceae bacterium]|nr:SDR family oxidoreductase [Streptosporangiaceae bacterium]MBV9854015.1 SDR family oxidoreductase [Streptosporangiaceae bacterium]